MLLAAGLEGWPGADHPQGKDLTYQLAVPSVRSPALPTAGGEWSDVEAGCGFLP